MGTPIVIVPSAEMDTPHFRIRRLRDEEFESLTGKPSYKIEVEEETDTETPVPAQQKTETAAVGQFIHTETAPPRPVAPTEGIFVRLFRWLFGTRKKPKAKPTQRPGTRRTQRNRGRSGQQARRGQTQRNRSQQRNRPKGEDRQQGQQGQQAQTTRGEQQTEDKKKSSSSRERSRGRRRQNKNRPQQRNPEQKNVNQDSNQASAGGKSGPDSLNASQAPGTAKSSAPDNVGNIRQTESGPGNSASDSWQPTNKDEPNGNLKPAPESTRSRETSSLQQVETRNED